MNFENVDDYNLETEEINTSFAKFKSAINAQYFNINSESSRIIYYGHFSSNKVTELVSTALKQTNYDVAVLENEIVVLFSRPLLVSELLCQGSMVSDRKSKTIRLISTRNTQKKFVSDFIITGKNNQFKVNDTVWGLILPTHTNLLEARVLDFNDFFTNEGKINTVTKAHQNLSIEIEILKDKTDHVIKEVAEYINHKASDYETIKNDIDIALKERKRLEDSSIENKEILDRIQNDIVKENKNLSGIMSAKDKFIDINNALKIQIDENSENLKKEIKKSDSLKTENIQKREEIKKSVEQINDMKRDINLTTLDLKGYSTESSKQLTSYFRLAFCAMVFLAVVFFQMYNNAETFANLFDNTIPKVNAWDILVSRLPLITATTLVVGTLSALLFYLVNHIVSVNSDNMNMLKASILAEQITGTLPTTDMSNDEIRDYKRNTKVELVMNVFTSKQEKIKDKSQFEQIKQILENLKLDK